MKLLLFLIMMMPLFGEKMEIVAYHVGKGTTVIEVSRNYYFQEESEDGFLMAGKRYLPREEAAKRKLALPQADEIVALERAPFESRFFGKGDQLYDVTKYVNFGKGVLSPDSQLIFNETSGKLVVKGPELTLMLLTDFFKRVDRPLMVTLRAAVYEVPRASLDEEKHRLRRKPNARKPLVDFEAKSRSGDVSRSEGGDLKLVWTPGYGWDPLMIDSLIDLKGKVKTSAGEVSLAWEAGIISYAGIAQLTELGMIGNSETSLLLSVLVTTRMMDGVALSDVVLSEDDAARDEARLAEAAVRYSEMTTVRQDDGRVLVSWRLPYDFLSFLDPNPLADGVDPFADSEEGVEETEQGIRREELIEADAGISIPRKTGDRIVNFRPRLEVQGIQFGEEDYAAYNAETKQLVAVLSEVQAELLDAVCRAASYTLPTLIETTFTIFEADQDFRVDELSRKDVKMISRLGGVSRPGDSSRSHLSLGAEVFDAEFGTNIGASDITIDLMPRVRQSLGKKVELALESSLTLKSGIPQIAQKFYQDGKWKALVIDARVRSLMDERR